MGIPRFGATLVAVVCISGCASSYVPPASGDMAHITFNKHKGSTTGIQIYDHAETCSSRHNVALLTAKPKESITVRAGAPLSITIGVDRAVIPLPIGFIVRGCNPTVTFTPQSNASYLADLVTAQNTCSIKLMRVNADQTTVDVPEDSVEIRKWKRGFDESSSFCD
jgi:hypothetical protein